MMEGDSTAISRGDLRQFCLLTWAGDRGAEGPFRSYDNGHVGHGTHDCHTTDRIVRRLVTGIGEPAV